MRRNRRVDGVAKLVDADALVVVAIQRQVQQVLFAKTRNAESARAANAFVLKRRVAAIPVLRHVGVNLIFADDDEPRAALAPSLPKYRADRPACA